MKSNTSTEPITAITHDGETRSNQLRKQLAEVEPRSLRTFTPSLTVIEKSEGAYHYTPEGRKLADFTSGVLVANLGHNPTRWWKRIFEYLGLDLSQAEGQYTAAVPLTAYNATTPIEIEACRRLLANLQSQPGGSKMQQVLWSASGSEAVQKALWACLSRRTGQETIIATRYGFHGKKGLAEAVTGSETDENRDPRVQFISFPMLQCVNLEARRQPLDLSQYEAELNILWEKFGSQICCLITEPYLGGGGSFHPQPEYLQLLNRFCKEHDIVFILDEIQANFGRTGPMYAFTHYGIEPDIVCLGKGLGNGIPVSAAVGRADILDCLSYGQTSDTWSANPLASAAVVSTLDEFEGTDCLAHAAKLSQIVEKYLNQLGQLPAVANIRGEGMVWGIESAAIGDLSADETANACIKACYLGDESGLAIHLLGALAGKVIRVSPPLTMELDEAEQYFQAMVRIFATVE